MSGASTLVALAGPSGAGKDAAAAYLVRRHGFRRIAVADPLKRWVQEIFGLDRDALWGDGRDRRDPRLGRTPREVYQRFGDACRDIDERVLVRALRTRVTRAVASGRRVVCPDVRTVEEIAAIREMGGRVYRILRVGSGAPGDAGRHRTETDVAALPLTDFDGVLHNDGALPDLHRALDRLLGG